MDRYTIISRLDEAQEALDKINILKKNREIEKNRYEGPFLRAKAALEQAKGFRQSALEISGMSEYDWEETSEGLVWCTKILECECDLSAYSRDYMAAKSDIEQYERDAKYQLDQIKLYAPAAKYFNDLDRSGIPEADFRRRQMLLQLDETDCPELTDMIFPNGKGIQCISNGVRYPITDILPLFFHSLSDERNSKDLALATTLSEGNIVIDGTNVELNKNWALTKSQIVALEKHINFSRDSITYRTNSDKINFKIKDDIGIAEKILTFELDTMKAEEILKEVRLNTGKVIRFQNYHMEH